MSAYRYVFNTPVILIDPYGLEVVDHGVDIVGQHSLLQALFQGVRLGRTYTNAGWETSGIDSEVVSVMPNPACSSCNMYVCSCTIHRKAVGTVQILLWPVKLGALPEVMAGFVEELNALAVWEENLHRNATLRWFQDHEKTGYGVGCNEWEAKLHACNMATFLYRVHEIAARAAWKEENVAIDILGDIFMRDIIRRGRAAFGKYVRKAE